MTRPPYPPSWYASSIESLPQQPMLEGNIDADVCILGAGYVGLSAALELAEAGYKVVVLEAERIGWGASGRNGGQALVGFGCGETKLVSLIGRDDARKLFDWSCEGMRLIRRRRERYNIDCDWRDGHATVAIKPRQIVELQAWQRELESDYGYSMVWWNREQLREQLDSPRYLGGLYDANAGHLHASLKLCPTRYCTDRAILFDISNSPLLCRCEFPMRGYTATDLVQAGMPPLRPDLDTPLSAPLLRLSVAAAIGGGGGGGSGSGSGSFRGVNLQIAQQRFEQVKRGRVPVRWVCGEW